MLAARLTGGRRIELGRTRIPVPAPDEVLVRVHSCALCGTDRRAYEEGSAVIPGHEISGVIQKIGSSVKDLGPGVAGVVYLVDWCGNCYCCKRGSSNMC